MMIRTAEQRGFTLIELAISVTLISVVFVVLYSCLEQIIESKRAIDDRRDSTAIAASIVGRITREFQLAYANTSLMPPPTDPDKRYNPRVCFLGEHHAGDRNESEDSVTFLALEGGQYLPDGGTHSGLVQITYRTEPAPEDERSDLSYLIRDELPYTRPFEKAHKNIMTFPITNRVVNFSVRYYSEDEKQWFEDWGVDAHSGLPQLVQFSLTLRSPLGKDDTFTTTVALRSKTQI